MILPESHVQSFEDGPILNLFDFDTNVFSSILYLVNFASWFNSSENK